MKNFKRKIIGATSLFLLLIASLGVTYAYYRTKIGHNPNNKSVAVTTALYKVEYQDGNNTVLSKEDAVPGETIGSKSFTVTNVGESDADYVLLIDNVSITNPTTGEATTFVSNDFVYTLSCVSKNKETNEVSGTCTSIDTETSLVLSNKAMLLTNEIPKNIKHEYTLNIKYKDTGVNQSLDMNKSFSFKLDIQDVKLLNSDVITEGTFAYSILENSVDDDGGTKLMASPLTIPGQGVNTTDEKVLTIAPDEYGTSYYFRGNVEDNYVNFANKCCRIVIIEGDGSVRLILEDSSYECNDSSYTGNWTIGNKVSYGYTSANRIDFKNESNRNSVLKKALDNYQTTLESSITITDYLKQDEWCYEDEGEDVSGTFRYYPSIRRKDKQTPTLKCEHGEKMQMYVGTLTIDEVILAGGMNGKDSSGNNYYNSKYYLYNTYSMNNQIHYWTLSPANLYTNGSDLVYFVNCWGLIENNFANNGSYIYARPAVTLKANIEISGGDGIISNPYVIE